ncbi:MAG: hypothetical protein ABL900_06080 [Burkholderiaceae bacterium]
MTDSELDAVYTQLCQTLTQLGEANASLYLARFALLAMTHIADGEAVQRLLDAAAHDLPARASVARDA